MIALIVLVTGLSVWLVIRVAGLQGLALFVVLACLVAGAS